MDENQRHNNEQFMRMAERMTKLEKRIQDLEAVEKLQLQELLVRVPGDPGFEASTH